MLSLVGLGLWDEKDITIKGINRAKKSDKVYIELYTSKWYGDLKKLRKLIEKEVNVLKREDLEEKSEKIIEEAKKKKIVIFVPGDPLVATTHNSLILNAINKGIEVEVIHNASIYSAIMETGLHVYKFGASATIPFPKKTGEVLPMSSYETLKENNKWGFHTLFFLDIDDNAKEFMTPNQGMKTLLELEGLMKGNVFTEDTRIVIFGRAGSDDPIVIYGKVKDLLNGNFGKPPFVIIVPGDLHFSEKEFLEYYKVKK